MTQIKFNSKILKQIKQNEKNEKLIEKLSLERNDILQVQIPELQKKAIKINDEIDKLVNAPKMSLIDECYETIKCATKDFDINEDGDLVDAEGNVVT